MRQLTLDEKISLRGLFARKGFKVPKLDMRSALLFWRMCYGCSIAYWFRILRRKGD